MMMTSNRRPGRIGGARLALLAGLLLAVGAAALFRAPLRGAAAQLFEPLLRARFAGEALSAETQLGLMRAAIADREALYQENLELKARLGRNAAHNRLLAGVLLRPPATPYDTLLIDAGRAEGVSLGDPVAAGGGLVIGTVSDLHAHSARVTLFSAPGERYDALLQTKGGSIPVEIEGQGGGSLRAQLPAGSAVALGDQALLPGIYGGLTATVSAITQGASESFVTVYFTVPIHTSAVRYVEVWKSR